MAISTSPTSAILQPGIAGIKLLDDVTGSNGIHLTVSDNTLVTGGPVGAIVTGKRAVLQFSRASVPSATFSDQTGNFIILQGNGTTFAGDVDAATVSFLLQGQPVTAAELAAKITDQSTTPNLGAVIR